MIMNIYIYNITNHRGNYPIQNNYIYIQPDRYLMSYPNSQNNTRTDAVNIPSILSININKNGDAKITIPSELLKPKNNSANKSCPNFTDLYDEIMKINLPEEFRFKFEGQAGLDYGGLTRDIFEKLLPVYTRRFFESVESNNEFVILKKLKDMPQPPQEKVKNKKNKEIEDIIWQIFKSETEKMVHLAGKAGTKIFLRIDPRLLALLQSKNYMEYFLNSKKSEQNFKNLYEYVNYSTNQSNNTLNNRTFLLNNTSRNIMHRFKESKNELTKNGLKREIRLRRFAIVCGFTTWEQFEKMKLFIQQRKSEYFTSELKFDIESFSKRLKITHNFKNLPLGTFGKLSEDKKKFVFKPINYVTNQIFTEYVFLLPFLNYMLGPESTDEIRKKTIAYIAGSSYYPGELKLHLLSQSAPYPFKASSCTLDLNFFKYNSETQIQINNKNKFIKSELEPKEGTQNFGLV
jgi:hypothetical protein